MAGDRLHSRPQAAWPVTGWPAGLGCCQQLPDGQQPPHKDDLMTPYGTAPPPSARGSLGLALVCGLGAAIAGAVVWGLIAYISKHQFSIVAVLMGLAVGSAVARFRNSDPLAAIASAVLAIFG